MKEFVKKSYNMTNAQHEREFKKYAQKIIRLNKSTELSIFNQLLQIWNELDIDFQLHVNKFINDIKLNDFLRDLNDKKHSWWKLINKQSFESISKRNVNAKNKNNREQRENKQSQRDIFETNYRDRDQSNVEYDDNVVDKYTQNDYFRFDIQSTFIFVQFSNFVSQNNYVSQNYVQTWNQNRVYMQQQQSTNQFSNAQSQQSILSTLSSCKQLTVDFSNQNQRNQSRENASDSNRRSFVFFNVNVRSFQSMYHNVNVNDVDVNDENNYYDDKTINDIIFVWHIVVEHVVVIESNQNQFEFVFLNDSIFHYDSMIMNASKFSFDDDKSNVNHVTSLDYICRLCKIEFYFNNKLHRHVRICRKKRVNNLSIIESVKIFHEHFCYE